MSNPAPSTYTGLGSVSISDYYQKLAQAFTSGNIASLNGFENNCACMHGSVGGYILIHPILF